MMRKPNVRELKSPTTWFWRSLFKPREVALPLTDPLHSDTPELRHAEIAAVYSGQRVAGDFYEFLRVGPSRMLFVLLDIAGLRADTRKILIAVQKTFRTLAPELLSGEDLNETTAMIELCYAMNLTILRGGVRSCPAFLGCYNEDLGTVCYANAGHTPGLLRDHSSIVELPATGLPLGLFSLSAAESRIVGLGPKSSMAVVSRGVVEAQCQTEEFGLAGVKHVMTTGAETATALSRGILEQVQDFMCKVPTHNDVTALTLLRGD